MADTDSESKAAVEETAAAASCEPSDGGDGIENIESEKNSQSPSDELMDAGDKEGQQELPASATESEKESSNADGIGEGLSLKRKMDEVEGEDDKESKRAKVMGEDGEGEEKTAAAEEEEKDEEPAERGKEELPALSVDQSANVTPAADLDEAKEDVKEAGEKETGNETGSEEEKSKEERKKEEVKKEEKVEEEEKMEVEEDVKKKVVKTEDPKESADSGAAHTSADTVGGASELSVKTDSKSEPVTDENPAELKTEPSEEQRRYPTRKRPDLAKESDDKDAQKDKEEESEEKVKGKEELSASGDSKSRESAAKSIQEKTPSVKSDGGSDKENQGADVPVDLSNNGTPDVIMLSDEEELPEPRSKSKEDLIQNRRHVKRLQSELRNEEAKLVLLKKLRQSQLAPQIQDHPSMPNSNSSSGSSNQIKANVQRQPGVPPPLVRGGQQVRSSSGMHVQQPQQGRSAMQGHSRNMQGPPPLIGAPRSGVNNTNGHGVQNMRGNMGVHSMGQHSTSSHRTLQQQQQQQHQQAATPPQPPVDTQTPAQRQAAAKLALRKQLEKTLLQIPPPKPPAPEMNFIPSLACPDFVLLLGLEEVVNHIIDLQLIARGQKSADEKFICNPFTCVQCGSDYTPVWKREKPGSKNVICEHCVTWNQKRALKQEHTNRLKSAFVKALQQEQEIERMQAQSLASTPPAPSPAVTPPAPIASAPPQALAAAANSVAAAAAMSLNSASYRASAEQVRQHHSFLQQAHQAQLRSGQPLGMQGFSSRSPFPYSLPYVKPADLQRQYLLDMIPRAGMPWKP